MNKIIHLKLIPAVCLISAALVECSLVSFAELSITSNPRQHGQVLAAGEPIFVDFHTPMIPSIKNRLKLKNTVAEIECRYIWQGAKLIIEPVIELKKGRRYRLLFKDKAECLDGREYDLDLDFRFYYITNDFSPRLIKANPGAENFIGIKTPLVFSFDQPVDIKSFAKYFSVSPQTEIDFFWRANDTEVTVAPVEAWRNLLSYSWTIGAKIVSKKGVGFFVDTKGWFRVQIDSAPPEIASLAVGYENNGNYYKSGPPEAPLPLDRFGLDQVLIIDFNEPVSKESLVERLEITPRISGHVIPINAQQFVYRFDEYLEPETSYSLNIKAGLEDLSGNQTKSASFFEFFTGGIPELAITEIRNQPNSGQALGTFTADDWQDGTPLEILIDNRALNTRHNFTVVFNQNIEDLTEKSLILNAISLTAEFPADLRSPELVRFAWLDKRTLELEYNRFTWAVMLGEPYNLKIDRYYRLTFAAAQTGLVLANGARAKEDVWINLVVEQTSEDE